MSSPGLFISVVEPDHTVKAPPEMLIGAKVIVVPMPSITDLLQNAARRARFAATRHAVREAIRGQAETHSLSDEDILNLVQRARQTSHTH